AVHPGCDRRANFLALHEILRERPAHAIEASRACAMDRDVGCGTWMLNSVSLLSLPGSAPPAAGPP
ncbi:MAG: hypothetical protein ACLPLP_21155, partial [Mycobacterium sp.]